MRKIMTLALCLAAGVASLVSCGNSSKVTANSTDNEAIRNILSRKSVRSFTDQEITEEQMNVMLRAAMAAPSGRDIRPWSFVILRDREQYAGIFGDKNFNMRIYMKSAAVVVICADTTVVMKARKDPDTSMSIQPNGTWRDDMGACTENFLLAAESLGLGAVWTACYPYPDRYLPVKKALGLPEEVVPYCVVAVGWPDTQYEPKDKWDPERIHYGKW